MDYLTTQEAARRLGVTRATVRMWALAGKIDCIRIVSGEKKGANFAIPALAVELELARRAK